MWETTEDESDEYGFGILLTVGYLPGVKANLIPLSARDQVGLIKNGDFKYLVNTKMWFE